MTGPQRFLVLLLGPGALWIAPPVAAQPAGASGQVVARNTHASTLCWHARPAPRCGAFLVTDFGVAFSVIGRWDEYSKLGEYRPVADWGLMFNTGPRVAVGASFYARDAEHFGPAFRLRRWTGARGSLDVGVGVLVGSREPGSVFGLVKYSPFEWIGVAVRPEIVSKPQFAGESRLRVSAGVELGSDPGAILTALVGLAVAAFLAGGGFRMSF